MWMKVESLKRVYRNRHRRDESIVAVNDVSFHLSKGERVGIIGESGCGKSTLARLMMVLDRPTSGRVLLEDRDVSSLSHRELLPFRRRAQMVFQDPASSLNPKMRVVDILSEPFKIHRQPYTYSTIGALLERVGLNPDDVGRYPHEFSGGQKQRIGIARAIALKPELLIADEPVSALDVSIQAGIINLIREVCDQEGMTLVFISHDMKTVVQTCDRILVMYRGSIVETIGADALSTATHPYTQRLISAVPLVGKRIEATFDEEDI